jgi:hypothetical protein
MKSIEKLVKKVISESMNEKAEEMTKKIHDKLSVEMAEEWGDYDFEYEKDELTDKARFAEILKRAMEKKGYLSKDEPKTDELEESMPSAEDYDYVQAESDCMEGDCGEMEESMARGEGEKLMRKYHQGAYDELSRIYNNIENSKDQKGSKDKDEDGEMEEGNAFLKKLKDTKKGEKFKLGGKTFTDTSDYDGEMEEGNAFTKELKQTKKGEKFKLCDKTYTDTSDLEESYSYSISFGKDTLKLTEEELISMIEELVVEQKAKSKGMVEYDRVHKKDEDINQKANKESFKKMQDYAKGYKGSFEENAKDFPKGNGELAKMDKKAYVPSEAVDEYVADFAYPGMTNLTFDEIKPDDERIKKYLEGDSTTGNSSEYANAVETEVGKKFFKNYKDNAYGAQQKKASYKRQPQPVDVAGENKGAKSYKNTKGQKALDKLSENVVKEEKENILSEEMVRMKEMIGYNKKSQ